MSMSVAELDPDLADELRRRIKQRISIEDRGHNTPCWISDRAAGGGGRNYTKIGITRGALRYGWYTHRLAYELFVGPIPGGLELDHRCDQPKCCNPGHLVVVTHRENLLRSRNRVADQRAQTKCKWGHEFDVANTYVDRRGRRHCRACRDRRNRRRKR